MMSKEHAKGILESLVNNEDIQSMFLRIDIEAMKCAISALSEEEDNTMEWIFDENETCSRCGYVVEGDHDTDFKFCPNCGRKAVQK